MNPSESAFPFVVPGGGTQEKGLSKRDFAAILAMQGLASEPSISGDPGAIAKRAYDIADTMMTQSAKGQKK